MRLGPTIAATSLALTLLVTGCGDDADDGDGAPEADELVELLEEGGMEHDMAVCMGDAYEAAGFTAEELRDMDGSVPDADSERYQRFAEEVRACTPSDVTAPAG